MKILFCIVVFLILTCRNECFAGNDNYTPYDIKSRTIRPLTVSPVIADKGEFRDKNITISCYPTKEEYGARIDIRYNNKLIEEIDFPISKDNLAILSDIYYVDIDGNNLPDVILTTTNLGSGLGTFYNYIIILLQTDPGKFRRLNFNTFYFDIKDFVDLKGDGKYELLMLSLAELKCSDGKPHSFWVYQPYEIIDFNLVMGEHMYPDFPMFVWYTEKPNNIPTDKLTRKQKEDYLKTLPRVIKSQEIK